MPAWIRAMVITVLLLGTVTGWAAAIFLGTQVLPQAQAGDATLEGLARSYVQTYVTVQKEADGYERLEPFVAGPALDALTNEAAAGGSPVRTLELVKGSFDVLWRSGNQALVAAQFTISVNSAEREIGEHYLMQMINDRWQIVQRWRLELDPGTPLVPGSQTSSPAPSEGAPSGSPAASQSPASSAGE